MSKRLREGDEACLQSEANAELPLEAANDVERLRSLRRDEELFDLVDFRLSGFHS